MLDKRVKGSKLDQILRADKTGLRSQYGKTVEGS